MRGEPYLVLGGGGLGGIVGSGLRGWYLIDFIDRKVWVYLGCLCGLIKGVYMIFLLFLGEGDGDGDEF